jgi:adenine-specific DNA-methyltransferase
LYSRIGKKGSFYKISGNELILFLEDTTQYIVDPVIADKPKKALALDWPLKSNCQLPAESAKCQFVICFLF